MEKVELLKGRSKDEIGRLGTDFANLIDQEVMYDHVYDRV